MPSLPAPPSSRTVLQALVDALERAGAYNRNEREPPASILWPDERGQWKPLLPLLRKVVPQLLTLGPYDREQRTGPAIWIRCMLAPPPPEPATWRGDAIPIVYLPGVSQAAICDIESCPKPLQPLAELQYRGAFFSEPKGRGRDWTLFAFLTSADGGLRLEVARDTRTLEALERAVIALADTRIDALTGRLEAAYFDQLLTTDVVRDLLRWLDDPKAARASWDDNRWQAFAARCRAELGFDPQTDGELLGAEKLAGRSGGWARAWSRFVESPKSYPGLPKLMRAAPPAQELFRDESPWPQLNEAREDELRKALAALAGSAPHAAVKEIAVLEERHGQRRGWVWADLDEAPLALALDPLVTLARVAGQELGGGSPAEMADLYRSDAWRADLAAVHALGCATQGRDVEAVKAAVRAVYLPWLERAAVRLQGLVVAQGFPVESQDIVAPGECILFADGLRYDIGSLLGDALTRLAYAVATDVRWAAVPSVTATSKPAVSPVADAVAGAANHDEFNPAVAASGRALTTDAFRKLLEDAGYQVLKRDDTGDPSGRAWTEHGDLDKTGHREQWKLVRRIDEQIRELVERIAALFAAGWKRIRIVTDHGWLLVPGGLPKVELPQYLAATRWGRCAVLKPSAQHGAGTMVLPWRWHEDVRIALAPGVACFYEGSDYAHGGLSLQECLTPVLTVSRAGATIHAVIAAPVWRGMRCRIQITGGVAGLGVDLRTKAGDPTTSLVSGGKALDPGGAASLLVEDDGQIGVAAFVVVLDASGTAITKRTTTIGEE
jgi:hypothetical protein